MIYAKDESAKFLLPKEMFDEIARKSGLQCGLGHKYYEQWRVLPPTSKEAMEIARKSEEYYKHFR